MAKRKLKNLANLNTHAPNAFANTAKTLKRKWKDLTGKENVAPETVGRPEKHQKMCCAPENASSLAVSTHGSDTSHQSLPRRILSSGINAVSPRLSRLPSDASDTPADHPITPPAWDTLKNSDYGHHDFADFLPSGNINPFEEMVTDPRDIDIPEGGDDTSNGYDTPPPITNDDDEPKNSPPLTKDGIPWEARAPLTIVMALEALEAIQGLLVVPHIPGKLNPKPIENGPCHRFKQL
ncbi:hypothetical protein B0H14DRAFT_2631957 [Mycena olivaceomarginata]|nr:hypothetical protein B0H14DRAFT_2631957 [Mycena olivaceomarginata]